MAKRQIIQIIDDLDGTVLEEGEGVTIRFEIRGRSYDIDLSDDNAKKLEEALAPFIAVATPVSSSAKADGSRAVRSLSKREDLAAVRAWARQNGHEVSERGRVAASILEAYDAAHKE